jgi:hypothetical protein
MRSGAIIYPLLINYAGLVALVPANKIFALRGQQPTDGPYIVYREISSVPLDTKGDSIDTAADPRTRQRSILDTTRVQISIFGKTYLEVEDIAVQVRQALDREWGSVEAPYQHQIELDSCIYESSVDDFDDDFNSYGAYIKHLDFKLRINRINIDNAWQNNLSLSFDGVDDYLNCGNTTDYTPQASGFSVSFWYKKSVNSSQTIINKTGGWAGGGVYDQEWAIINRFNDTLLFNLNFNNSSTDYVQLQSVQTLPLNQWIHIVITYDYSQTATGFNMYIDNVLLNTTNGLATVTLIGSYGNVTAGASQLYIARNSATGYFEFLLDEFILYKKVIDAATVNHLYNNGITGNPNETPYATSSMISYFRMGDGAVFPTIPNLAPSYTLAGTMTNMDAVDIITDTPA